MTTIYQFFSTARTRSSGFARVLSFLMLASLWCATDANAADVTGRGTIASATTSSNNNPDWEDVNNAASANTANFAQALLNGNGDISEELRLRAFGFSIPTGASIDGITVNIRHSRGITNQGGGTMHDQLVQIRKNVTTAGTGANKAQAIDWGANQAGTVLDYGSNTDKWGLTWTAAEINSANFGIAIVALKVGSGQRYANIHRVDIDVTYTAIINGTPTTVTVSSNVYGTASTGSSIAVTGAGMDATSGDITVAAPTGFEVSTSLASGYTSSVTVARSGASASGTVYVRTANNTNAGTPTGNVVLSTGNSANLDIPVTGTVLAKELTITGLTANDKTYDRSSSATVTGSPTAAGTVLSETVAINGTGIFAFASPNAGTHNVTYTSGYTISNANYVLSATPVSVLSATINAKQLTYTSTLAGENKVYDKTTTATTTGSVTFDGVISPDVVNLTTGTVAFTSDDAGTGVTITALGYGIASGGDGANYIAPTAQPSVTAADITAKQITLAGLTGNNKVYDASASATVATAAGLPSGAIISGDDVTLSLGTQAFDNANVGTGKAITATGYTLSGSDAGNYALTAQPAVSVANVTPFAVTITPNTISKCQSVAIVGTANTQFTYSPTTLAGAETITSVNLTSAGFPNSATSGTYAIAVSGTPNAQGTNGFLASNYAITPGTGATVTVLNNVQGSIISSGNVDLCKGQNPSIVLNLTGTPTFSGTFEIFQVVGNTETSVGTHQFEATVGGNGVAVILPSAKIPNETNQMVTYVVRLVSLSDATNVNSVNCSALPTSLGGQVYLNVYPTPIMTAVLTSAATICANGNVAVTTTNTNGVPATYKVTATYPTGVTGNVPALGTPGQAFGTFNDVLVSSTLTAPATVTYTFTPIANGTGGCNGDPKIVSVIVNPTPVINAVNDVAVCANTVGATVVEFSGALSGVTYNWEQTNPTVMIGLGQSTGTGDLNFTATNTGATQLVANFTVTPTIGACAGTSEMFNIVVNPTATIGDVTAPAAVCMTDINSSSIQINGLIQNVPTHFLYTVNAGLEQQVGGISSSTGIINYSPANFGLTTPGTYVVNLSSVRASFDIDLATFINCPSVAITKTFTITINPTPTFTAIAAPATVCENNLTGDIVITGLLAGEDNTINYNITGEATEQSFTIPASSLVGTTATLPLSMLSTPTPGTYTVTVNSVAANGCQTNVTTANTFTTTIYPTPTFTSIAAPATVCENNLVGNIVISGLTNGVVNTLTYNITGGNNPMTMVIPAAEITGGVANLPLNLLSTPTPGVYTIEILSVATNDCVEPVTTNNTFTTEIYPTPTFGEIVSTLANVCIDDLATATFTMDDLLPSTATTFHYDVFFNGGTTPITSNIDTLTTNGSGVASFDASMFSGVVPGSYMIQINKVVVNGCETIVTANNTAMLNVNEAPEFATTPFAPTQFADDCLTEVVYTVPALVSVSAVPTTYSYVANGPNSFTSAGTGTGSGLAFPIGTSTVAVAATNDCGSDTLIFDVVVTDTTAPVLTVINNTLNLNVGAGAGCTVPMPDYTTGALANVTVANHCASNAITLTQLTPNDIGDDVIGYGGTRTVYIRAADEYGNADTVSFTLVLIDATAPTVNTQNITVQLDATGNTSITPAQVNNNSVDNCTPVTLVSVSPSTFTCANIGTPVTVTLTVKDALNNISTGTAIVTVADTVKPLLPLLADTTVAKGPLCTNTLGDFKHRLPASMYSTFDACGILSVTQSPTATAIIAANTASVNVTLTVTDVNNNVSTRSFVVNYTDQTAPKFVTAPTTIVRSNDAGTCGAVVTWTTPTASDNCTDIAPPTVTQTAGPASGTVFAVGTTTSITYTANDGRGNTYDSTFTVTVNDTELPTITNLPTSMSLATTTGCTAVATWPTVVGADNCTLPTGAVTYTTSPTANLMNGDAFPTGVTTVTYTVVDAANNQTTGSFTVTVTDGIAPVINNIPANIVATPNTTGCSAIVTWTAPTFTDCNQANTTMVSNFAPGATFPVGVTTVTYTATDASNNVSTASFTVTVNNNLVGNLTGTSTVSQNVSTTSNVTFIATSGTAPFTFSYKINGGNTQTIVSNLPVVTIPQSNANLGTFIFSLVAVNDAYCNGVVSNNDTAIVTVVPFVPIADLYVGVDVGATSFNPMTTRPYTLKVGNMGSAPKTGIIVSLANPAPGFFNYTLDIASSSNGWVIVPSGSNYTLINNTITLAPNDEEDVYLNVNMTTLAPAGTMPVSNSVVPAPGEVAPNTSNNRTSFNINVNP